MDYGANYRAWQRLGETGPPRSLDDMVLTVSLGDAYVE
jgi:hypothetical protein